VFAICAALRLARFNVQIEDPNRPSWAGNFFTGVPAPAGAITVLLPMYLYFLQLPMREPALLIVVLIYTFVVAGLMVSRLPVLSGKKMGTRVRPDLVLPVILLVVLFIALLVSYPWHVLSVGTIAYLGCLPLGWSSYQRYLRADADAAAGMNAVPEDDAAIAPAVPPADEERPARLN
jgi:CDP-diacylglycerol--serine O-phosphatidyltransferase